MNDQKLTFQVSGKLWMRSLVMRDVETGSEWSHLLGRAMAGPLKGNKLKPLITDMLTWQAWKSSHPDTTVLNLSRTSREYTSEFYRDPSQFVFGFDVGGQAYALPMEHMREQLVLQFELSDESFVATFDQAAAAINLFDTTLGDTQFVFRKLDGSYMQDVQNGSRWSLTSGQAIDGPNQGARLKRWVGIMSYRKAWMNFHPQSKDIR